MFEWVKQNYKNQSSRRAFTLLESIVAIYVLLLGIVGAMSLAERNITSVLTLKDQLVAANLAQEGMELVRNKRDSNYLTKLQDCKISVEPACNANNYNMDGMTTGDIKPCYEQDCRIKDPVPNGDIEFDSCLNLDDCLIYVGSDGVYNQKGGNTRTKFTRIISIEEARDLKGVEYGTGVDELNVKTNWSVRVTVSWESRFAKQQVQLKTYLTPIFDVRG